MKIRIVSDSSSNLFELKDSDFVSTPLKIITSEKEYIDDCNLDVSAMLNELSAYKGKSGSSCPNTEEWLSTFGDADIVYGAVLTSKLSGAYTTARMAADEYMEMYPDRKVFILDSLSTGPDLELLVEKYAELVTEGKDFDEICAEIKDYMKRTHLMFSLESLQNFANNGRVSPTVAAAAKIFGICIVGRASDEGELEPLHKKRGRKKAVLQIWECMKDAGFAGGKVRIRHSVNEDGANAIAALIRSEYPECDLKIGLNYGVCSFYAEAGGLLVAFESN